MAIKVKGLKGKKATNGYILEVTPGQRSGKEQYGCLEIHRFEELEVRDTQGTKIVSFKGLQYYACGQEPSNITVSYKETPPNLRTTQGLYFSGNWAQLTVFPTQGGGRFLAQNYMPNRINQGQILDDDIGNALVLSPNELVDALSTSLTRIGVPKASLSTVRDYILGLIR